MTTVEQDRQRLTSRDPLALLIANFVEGDAESLEIIAPEDGEMINGVRFRETSGTTPVKLHQRVYTMALRMHYLKKDVWVYKNDRSTWLYKTEEAYLAAREARKVKK